jgi:hypothetical protein
MTYSCTASRLVVSRPGDIPVEDIAAVTESVNRWNAIYGPQFGAVVVPLDWQQHSTAEHGRRPQASLNAQLVEQADILIALFWHRFGSPTGEADSGTIEEIQEAHKNGAYVGILRCTRDFPQADSDLEQIARLREFFADTRTNSLILDYGEASELSRHVDAILNRAVTGGSARAEASVGGAGAERGADVWPRIESSEQVRTDSRGRVNTSRRWQLVLSNTGTEPARDVRYRLEAENPGDQLPVELEGGEGERRGLEVLAPEGEAAYGLVLHMGVVPQFRCVVRWSDSHGEHENRATLRVF